MGCLACTAALHLTTRFEVLSLAPAINYMSSQRHFRVFSAVAARAGVRGLWAVHDAAAAAGCDLHPYLVIGTASTTRVLEDSRALTGDGDDLNEVSNACAASFSCKREGNVPLL